MRLTEDMALRAVAELCRRDMFFFMQTFWSTIIKEEPVYNWHIPYLCKELQTIAECIIERKPKPYDLIVNIPPGTTKSTIVTIIFPVWLWINDPTVRIITNSYSGGLSIDHSTRSKDILQSDRFRLLFPEVQIRHDKSGKSNYENTAGGFRYATSTGGTITGLHAHVIINDDPQNPKQSESEKWRQAAILHTATLSTRKVDKANTPTITIMQRLHQEDVTGYLLKLNGDRIRHINLPAEDCEDVRPAELRANYRDGLLDPLRLSRQVLDDAKTYLGSRGYAGQFMQQPTAEGGNIIKEEWLQYISLAEFTALRFREPVHFFLDTAYDEQHGDNDPSGIIAACKIRANIYIIKAAQVWKDFPALIRWLPEFMRANGGDSRSTLRIEPKASGKSVAQQLRAISELNVTYTPSPTDSKAERLHAVSPKIECGRVWIVEGEWNDEFVSEVTGFPQMAHDEFVDILGYAINYFDNEDVDIPDNLDSLI